MFRRSIRCNIVSQRIRNDIGLWKAISHCLSCHGRDWMEFKYTHRCQCRSSKYMGGSSRLLNEDHLSTKGQIPFEHYFSTNSFQTMSAETSNTWIILRKNYFQRDRELITKCNKTLDVHRTCWRWTFGFTSSCLASAVVNRIQIRLRLTSDYSLLFSAQRRKRILWGQS